MNCDKMKVAIVFTSLFLLALLQFKLPVSSFLRSYKEKRPVDSLREEEENSLLKSIDDYNITTTVNVATTASQETQKRRNCSPHCKLVFVKTHKTASSSVLSIIREHMKRCGSHKRQPYFPAPFVGGYPGHFNSKFLISRDLKSFRTTNTRLDVIDGHLRFDKTELEAVMPRETKYITILRDPSAAFHSAFSYYYGETQHFNLNRKNINCNNSPYIDILGKINGTFSEYLRIASTKLNPKVPWYFRPRYTKAPSNRAKSMRSMNYQAHDLGLNPMSTDEKYVKEQIRHLDSSFNLVMIAEYFQESLVLLKEELCMNWSYLTTKIMNSGKYKTHNYTLQESNVVRNLNKLDYALYAHFNRTLWRKIKTYGKERMAEDIKKIPHHPTPKQFKTPLLKQPEKNYLNKDVASYYKTNTAEKLTNRLAKGSSFSSQDDKIKEMAKYILDNSGGCNF